MNDVFRITEPDWIAERLQKFSGLDNEQLDTSIRRSIEMSVENMLDLAVQFRLAEDRGMDLSKYRRTSLLHVLRKIGRGECLRGILERFSCNLRLLGRAAKLPLKDQQRLLESEGIEVAHCQPNGSMTTAMVQPSNITPKHIAVIFAADHLRMLDEQYVHLRQIVHDASPHPFAHANCRLDLRRRGIVVNGPAFLSIAELSEAIAALTHK